MRRALQVAAIVFLLAVLSGVVYSQSGSYQSPATGGATYTGSSPIVVSGTAISCPTCGTGTGNALTSNPLSQFAATTSAQLAGVLSDETGTGAAVFANTPTLVTPNIGAATGTSLTTTAGLTSGANGGTAGSLVMNGATSGAVTLTVSATSNNLIDSTAFSATNITGSGNVGGAALQIGGVSVVNGNRDFMPGFNLVAFSATPTISSTGGNFIQFPCTTAGSAITPTFTNFAKGIFFTVIFVQNGTTACTWTWPSNIHGGVAVSATLSSVSVEQFAVSNNGTDAYLISSTVGTTGGTP